MRIAARCLAGAASALALVLAVPSVAAAGLPLHPRASDRRDPPVLVSPRLARLEPPPAAKTGEPVLSRGDGPPSAAERDRRNAVVEGLLEAEARATESPRTAVPTLEAALQAMADVAPLVADDDYAQQARIYAQLALARTLLALEQPERARDAIDEALRTARGTPLPAGQFGPALKALHDERSAAMADVPPAVLDVRCSVPCRVLVDERPFESGAELPAGAHRVWIEAVAAGVPVLRRELVAEAGQRVELPFEAEVPAAAEPEPEPRPEPGPPDGNLPTRRILPRWASALGLGVGVGMAGAGGALVAVDHRCPDLSDPREVECLRILNTDAGGYVLIGIGSAMAITGAVILAVDEIRAKRAERR